jgi:hypothetical protein
MARNSRLWTSSDVVRSYGGITSPRDFRGSERAVLEYAQVVVERTRHELEGTFDWSLDKLDFFFVNRRDVNAAVVQHGGRHAVALCVGLPLRIKRLLDRAMRNPEFLPGYLSRDERPEWSQRFLGMIVEHAFLHEVAHATRGHFAYLNRGPSSAEHLCLDERARSGGKYLELDADLQALDMWATITRTADDFPTTPHFLEELYFQRLLSLILLYQALDESKRPVSHYARGDHPAPIHRSMLLTRAMHSSGRSYFGLDGKRLRNVHEQAHSEASVAAETWKLTRDRWWGGRTGRHRNVRVYARQVRYYLKVFEPRLDAFAETLPDDLV